MNEVFETVLILSLFGFGITAFLLLLKPITAKKFPAKWQYYVWTLVLISMIVPIYKFIPKEEAQKLTFITDSQPALPQNVPDAQVVPPNEMPDTQNPGISTPKVNITDSIQSAVADMMDILSYIWFWGMVAYFLIVVISYTIYLLRKRRHSFLIADNPIFESAKSELGIKRNIRLKMSDDVGSPMLVGLFLPTVYIPAKNIADENMRMVFLHELTHYKRRDLLVKWFSLFVNAVHWFNPLAYLLCSNISEACEISCDMEVTHNMLPEEQKLYMKTIVDLAG